MRGWMALAVLGVALAGCSDLPADVPDEIDAFDEELELGDGPAIRGVVVDAAIVPLPDVTVDFDDRSVVTDDEGRFAFADVELGVHLLELSKPGYFTMQSSVTVTGEDDPIVRVRMESDPQGIPYHQVSAARGFLQCGVGIPPAGSYSMCQTPNGVQDITCDLSGGAACTDYVLDHRGIIEMDVESMPTHLQAEGAWDPTADTARVLTWSMYARERGTIELANSTSFTGESPVLMPKERADIVAQDIGASRILAFQVFPEFGGIGNVVLEQEVELFLTVFYNKVPAEGWSLVLDGEPI